MRAKDINRAYLLIVLLYLIGANIISLLFPAAVENDIGSVLIAQALILTGTAAGCVLLKVHPVSHMRLCSVPAGVLAAGAACTAALYPFLTLISTFMRQFVRSGTDALSDTLLYGNLTVNLIIYALIPACVEECMNRGLLYRGYRKFCGPRKAALLSGLLFGLFHMNLDQFSYTFVFGVFLCLVAEAADSLLPCIACHFTLNAISVISSNAAGTAALSSLSEVSRVLQNADSVVSRIVLLVVCAGAAAAFFLLLLHACGREQDFREAFFAPPSAEDSGDQRIFSAELAVACGICILSMLCYELYL